MEYSKCEKEVQAIHVNLANDPRFGIEFAPEVVQADGQSSVAQMSAATNLGAVGNVRNLAWRVCNAKKVLV